MSSTKDGRGRRTGTFIDLYSFLRFALRPFDDPTAFEESQPALSGPSEFLPVSDGDGAVASIIASSLLLSAELEEARWFAPAESWSVASILLLPPSISSTHSLGLQTFHNSALTVKFCSLAWHFPCSIPWTPSSHFSSFQSSLCTWIVPFHFIFSYINYFDVIIRFASPSTAQILLLNPALLVQLQLNQSLSTHVRFRILPQLGFSSWISPGDKNKASSTHQTNGCSSWFVSPSQKLKFHAATMFWQNPRIKQYQIDISCIKLVHIDKKSKDTRSPWRIIHSIPLQNKQQTSKVPPCLLSRLILYRSQVLLPKHLCS